VKNFTDLGFAVVNAPTELHQRLKAKLHASLEAKSFRSEMNGRPAQGIYGDTYPDFVDHGERSILQELQPIHEVCCYNQMMRRILPLSIKLT